MLQAGRRCYVADHRQRARPVERWEKDEPPHAYGCNGLAKRVQLLQKRVRQAEDLQRCLARPQAGVPAHRQALLRSLRTKAGEGMLGKWTGRLGDPLHLRAQLRNAKDQLGR